MTAIVKLVSLIVGVFEFQAWDELFWINTIWDLLFK